MSASNDIKRYAEKEFNKHGWHIFRVNAGHSGHYNRKQAPDGTADLIGWTPDGCFCGFEVKVGNDELRPEQKVFLHDLFYTKHGYPDIIRSVGKVDQMIRLYPNIDYDEEIHGL